MAGGLCWAVAHKRDRITYRYHLNEDATKAKLTFYVWVDGDIVYSNYTQEGYTPLDSLDIVKAQIEKDWEEKIKKLKPYK